MQQISPRVLLRTLAYLVAILVLLFGAIDCGPINAGRSTAQSAEARRFAITIKNRKLDPAQKLIRVTRGDTLDLEFSTDEAVELHLHGYDKLIKVEPSVPAVLRLEATIAGRFSIEAHGFWSGNSGQRGHSHVVLLYLEVHPR
jgi:hypothetical protein